MKHKYNRYEFMITKANDWGIQCPLLGGAWLKWDKKMTQLCTDYWEFQTWGHPLLRCKYTLIITTEKKKKAFQAEKRKELMLLLLLLLHATCYMLNSLFLKTAKALAVETLSPCPSFSKYASLHPYLCRCLRERIYISKECTNEKKNLKKCADVEYFTAFIALWKNSLLLGFAFRVFSFISLFSTVIIPRSCSSDRNPKTASFYLYILPTKQVREGDKERRLMVIIAPKDPPPPPK